MSSRRTRPLQTWASFARAARPLTLCARRGCGALPAARSAPAPLAPCPWRAGSGPPPLCCAGAAQRAARRAWPLRKMPCCSACSSRRCPLPPWRRCSCSSRLPSGPTPAAWAGPRSSLGALRSLPARWHPAAAAGGCWPATPAAAAPAPSGCSALPLASPLRQPGAWRPGAALPPCCCPSCRLAPPLPPSPWRSSLAPMPAR